MSIGFGELIELGKILVPQELGGTFCATLTLATRVIPAGLRTPPVTSLVLMTNC